MVFVAFALISVAADSFQPPSYADALDDALTPGKSVLRYNRLWRLPQHSIESGWISGRIGFEYPNSSVGVWDDQQKDYRSIRPAQVTRYMIDVASHRVAFELKSSTIKPWTFQGNFQALLNEESIYQWRVELEDLTQPTWDEWVESVSRVTDLRVRMERPNPRYPGKEIEHLFEDAKLSAATLAVQGDDVELTESELLVEAIRHAHRGYGRITAKGVAGTDGRKTEWRSEDDLPERAQAERDPATGEVAADGLRQLLERRRHGDPE